MLKSIKYTSKTTQLILRLSSPNLAQTKSAQPTPPISTDFFVICDLYVQYLSFYAPLTPLALILPKLCSKNPSRVDDVLMLFRNSP